MNSVVEQAIRDRAIAANILDLLELTDRGPRLNAVL